MTGKGDRWGRDSVGRFAPAFLSANTFALPPPTCTARREAGQLCGSCCGFAAKPANCWLLVLRPVPGGESAGCVCLQCLFSGLLFALPSLPAMPTALIKFLPPFSLLCPHSFALFAFHLFLPCAPGSFEVLGPAVCKLRELSRWQLQHGPAVAARAPGPFDCFSFSCRVHDPGPWV